VLTFVKLLYVWCITHLCFIGPFQVQKQVCDNYDPSFYPRFKKWCDDYFYIKVSLSSCLFDATDSCNFSFFFSFFCSSH
jgi:coproporphyrinogen III oxidase